MAPDLSVVACPACGAGVRPGAPWCTQCYAALTPPDPEPTRASDVLAPAVPAPRADQPADGVPTWPCTGCGTANPMSADACEECGQGFLAQVRTEEPPLLALPGLGDVTTRSRGQLAALACGGVLVVVLVCLVLFLAMS